MAEGPGRSVGTENRKPQRKRSRIGCGRGCKNPDRKLTAATTRWSAESRFPDVAVAAGLCRSGSSSTTELGDTGGAHRLRPAPGREYTDAPRGLRYNRKPFGGCQMGLPI